MNILFFSSNSPYSEIGSLKGQTGGAEINLRVIAEELAKLNHNVYYYSIKKGVPIKKNINGVYTCHLPNIYLPIVHKNLTLIKNFNENFLFLQKKFYIEKTIKKKNIDIVHTYSTYPDTFVSAIAARKNNIPIVQRVGGRPWFNKIEEDPDLKGKIEWTFNNVDMLLFNSDFIKDQTYDYFQRLGFKVGTPCKTVDIGMDYSRLGNLDVEWVKSKYNLLDHEIIILCVESFKHYSKRQDILIRALPNVLERFNNLKVIFVGDGPTLQQMKHLAQDLGVDQNINFLGNIAHGDVLAIMSIAEIVVHPTEFEAFSTVLKESFSLEKPFLVSNIESMKNIVQNGNNALLAENDPMEFAEKIIYLLENKDRRKKIGENAAKYAKKYFDSRKNILKYEKIFLDIIHKNKDKMV